MIISGIVRAGAGKREGIFSMKLTAEDILQIALELERLGLTFYESLSAGCGDAKIAALAAALAKAEREHINTFERMRDALAPHQRGTSLTSKELLTAVNELRKRIMPGAKAVLRVVQAADILKALDMAIEMETEAVAFYAGLTFDLSSLESEVLTDIAKEEEDHLVTLKEVRQLLSC